MLIGEFYEKAFQLSDETLIQKLMQMTEISFFKKGEIIVRQDEIPSKIYFLLDGVFRGFFFDAHGKKSRIVLVLKWVRRLFPVWESGILLPLPWKR